MKYIVKTRRIYNYNYDNFLYKLVEGFKKSLACKDTFLQWLYREFSDIKLELFSIPDKECYLYANSYNNNWSRYSIEISRMVILQNGSNGIQLSKAVQKRAYRLVNSIVSL